MSQTRWQGAAIRISDATDVRAFTARSVTRRAPGGREIDRWISNSERIYMSNCGESARPQPAWRQ
jgi:hypothetical protein